MLQGIMIIISGFISFFQLLYKKPKIALLLLSILFSYPIVLIGYIDYGNRDAAWMAIFLVFWFAAIWGGWIFWFRHERIKKERKEKEKDMKHQAIINPAAPSNMQSVDIHGFIFGEKNGKIMRKAEHTDGHVLVVGGTGTGKTSCLAIPSLLSWNGRVFAIDIKGELRDKTKEKRKNILYFNPEDDEAFGYNPFEPLMWTDNPIHEAQRLAQTLIPAPENSNADPFWITSARDMFSGAILHYFHEGYSFIETVEKILETPVADLMDEISRSKTDGCLSFVNGFIGAENSMFDTYKTLATHIRLFKNPALKNALSKADYLKPADLENQDIYITIQPQNIELWQNLWRLIVKQFFDYFDNRPEKIGGKPAAPILFVIDEFDRLGKIDGIKNALSTLRYKKITISLFLQSLSQLDNTYSSEVRDVICDNCKYTALLSARTTKTQEEYAKLIGRHWLMKIGKGEQLDTLKNLTGTNKNESEEDFWIIRPHELGKLEDIIVLHEKGFCRVNKLPYYKHRDLFY